MAYHLVTDRETEHLYVDFLKEDQGENVSAVKVKDAARKAARRIQGSDRTFARRYVLEPDSYMGEREVLLDGYTHAEKEEVKEMIRYWMAQYRTALVQALKEYECDVIEAEQDAITTWQGSTRVRNNKPGYRKIRHSDGGYKEVRILIRTQYGGGTFKPKVFNPPQRDFRDIHPHVMPERMDELVIPEGVTTIVFSQFIKSMMTMEDKKLKAIPARLKIKWLYQVALGIQALMERNYYHSDIATKNIIVVQKGDDMEKWIAMVNDLKTAKPPGDERPLNGDLVYTSCFTPDWYYSDNPVDGRWKMHMIFAFAHAAVECLWGLKKWEKMANSMCHDFSSVIPATYHPENVLFALDKFFQNLPEDENIPKPIQEMIHRILRFRNKEMPEMSEVVECFGRFTDTPQYTSDGSSFSSPDS